MDWYLFSTLVLITVVAMYPEQELEHEQELELEIEKSSNHKYGHSCCFFCRCSPRPSIL